MFKIYKAYLLYRPLLPSLAPLAPGALALALSIVLSLSFQLPGALLTAGDELTCTLLWYLLCAADILLAVGAGAASLEMTPPD